jgi:GPI-anchor transamidase subunit GAA1
MLSSSIPLPLTKVVEMELLTAILLSAAIRNLRNNPHFLFVRLPNVLSLLCIVVGVVWLLLLPLNDYSRQTYISENALLPGQVHAYFTGSEQNVFRGYKKELQGLIAEGRENGVPNPEVVSTPAYVKPTGDVRT